MLAGPKQKGANMNDFYKDGFNDGYGRKTYGDREYPQNDSDDFSYRRGRKEGQRRRGIANELEEKYF